MIHEQVWYCLWHRMTLNNSGSPSNTRVRLTRLSARLKYSLHFQKPWSRLRKGHRKWKHLCVSLQFSTRRISWKWKPKSDKWRSEKRLGDGSSISRLFSWSVSLNFTWFACFREESPTFGLSSKLFYCSCISRFYSDSWLWVTQSTIWKTQNYSQCSVRHF